MENALDKLAEITDKMVADRLASDAKSIAAYLTGQAVLKARDNGISYTIGATVGDKIIVEEFVDLNHPDCPVVSRARDVSWVIARYQMSKAEFAEKFGDWPIQV